jgi:hypothetical protein
MIDQKKIAVIHVVIKRLGLSDVEYRSTLQRVAGVKSSKDLDETGFRKLMKALVQSPHFKTNAYGMTIKQKMFIEYLADHIGYDQGHLENYLNKYFKHSLETLNRKQASNVIAALKHILTSQKDGHSRVAEGVRSPKGESIHCVLP